MKILAADTATSINTVAVCDGPRILAETVVECGRAHSERLIITVDWVLAEAGLTLEDLDALAISAGPGSFTGVRVGVATWKGLAFGKNLPLVAVPTLDAMTRLSRFQDALVCPLLDARMHEVYGAVYRFANGRREKLTEDLVCDIDAMLNRIEATAVFLGDGASMYRDRILARQPGAIFAPGLCSKPRASAVAAEALALIERGANTDAQAVVPVYLRKSQAEVNRDKRRDAAK
jgi:tRNA threonylcarbamoyl adenosine modification protein YeaZ